MYVDHKAGGTIAFDDFSADSPDYLVNGVSYPRLNLDPDSADMRGTINRVASPAMEWRVVWVGGADLFSPGLGSLRVKVWPAMPKSRLMTSSKPSTGSAAEKCLTPTPCMDHSALEPSPGLLVY